MTSEKKSDKKEMDPPRHNLVSYPKELPTHSITHIIQHLRGIEVLPLPELGQHFCTAGGCAFEMMKSSPTPVGAGAESSEDCSKLSDEELADKLSAATAPQGAEAGAESLLPLIMPYLIEAAMRIFSGWFRR